MKKLMIAALAMTLTACFAGPITVTPAEAAKKLTKEQRKKRYKEAMAWCRKKIGGGSSIEHMEIKSDGRVICWYR